MSEPQTQIAQRLSGRHLGKMIKVVGIGPQGRLEAIRHEFDDVVLSIRLASTTAEQGELAEVWMALDEAVELLT